MLRFEAYRGPVWRMIEGQFRPSTLKITDSAAEQERLEALPYANLCISCKEKEEKASR